MTDDEIRELLRRAAPGKWSHPERKTGRMDEVRNESGTVIASCMFAADAELMAAAPGLAYDLLLTRLDLAEYEDALREIHAACVAAGIPEETVSETGTTTRHRTAQLVAWMAEELARARAVIRDTCEALDGGETEPERLAEGVALLAGRHTGVCAESRERLREVERLRAQLAAYEADEPDGWISYHSEMGMEWHDSRASAEAEAVDAMTGLLHDEGEAHDDQAIVLRVVAHTREVVQATSDDDSEDGEWCRDHGVDYMVSGYEIRPGSGVVEVPDEG